VSPEKESNQKREFSELTSVEKVAAILGASLEPVSKELAIDLAGIDITSIDEDTKIELEELFDQDYVVKSEKKRQSSLSLN